MTKLFHFHVAFRKLAKLVSSREILDPPLSIFNRNIFVLVGDIIVHVNSAQDKLISDKI